jgi:hypothetical protein
MVTRGERFHYGEADRYKSEYGAMHSLDGTSYEILYIMMSYYRFYFSLFTQPHSFVGRPLPMHLETFHITILKSLYRVRRRNARLGVTPGEHHIVNLKNEVIEPPTTAIIMRYFSSLVNKGLQSICTIYIF